MIITVPVPPSLWSAYMFSSDVGKNTEYSITYAYSLEPSEYILVNEIKSPDDKYILFKQSQLFLSKKEDDMIILEWLNDKDVFGMGKTREEALIDLLYNIEGILLLQTFPEEELSESAKNLFEKVSSTIKETNLI